jgi:hypothetical protein
MSDPTLALQGWIVTTLTGGSPPALSVPVYDKVPPQNPFPRVTIGPGQSLPGEDDGQCNSTFEVFQQIDVWSRTVGFPEAKTVAGAVKDLLHHAEPSLTGFNVVLIEWLSTDYSRDSDGLTSRARMQFRALIDAA